ncbi:hypothetical protein NITMOv2_4367 [Nitrospira moscoviensis]|uniref:Uncharacterized protein n=1 Tax=Nitrospira moscoviensis TaxID=42253 RepID=A0A0K2GIF3_NITMO|nr:hypothetical protein NITMOv2_4367 [Nitrospira moscoviensis]
MTDQTVVKMSPERSLNQRALGSTPTRPTKPNFVRTGGSSGAASYQWTPPDTPPVDHRSFA